MKPAGPTALVALGERWGLDERQLGQLEAVLGELETCEWAPSAVRERPRAIDAHIADSLSALGLDAVCAASTIADIGAGAGFPGLALAVALPRTEVSLVESRSRRCAFIERACAAGEIENARVVCARAEEWSDGMSQNEVVVVRALAAQPVVLEYAAPLLVVGGQLVDWRGRRDADEEAQAACAADQLGMRLLEVRYTEPYAAAREHRLHVFEKIADTPPRFPRRAGAARKRPLG